MEAHSTRTGTRLRATAGHARYHRLALAVAALASALAASAALIPAAWASNVIPNDGGPAPAPAVYAVGMPGWQITLIAVASALVAAVTAVLLDRARTAGRARTASRAVRPAA
jgi:hypothetical protein